MTSHWGDRVVRTVAIGAILTGAATLGGVGVSSAWADTNLVVDGSFESVTAIGTNQYTAADNPDAIPGWTIGPTGSAETDDTTYGWQADTGIYSVDLSGNSPGSISQDIPTTPGTSYTLSYALSGNFNCGSPVKTLGVFWDGTEVATEDFDTTGDSATDMNWTPYSLTVAADSSATTTELEFADVTPNGADLSCGPVIDSVSVTPTPGTALPEAPFTIGLPLAAVGVGAGILFLRRRRTVA